METGGYNLTLGGWRGIESGPAPLRRGPQHGRCRDEVRRCGSRQKPIQNPYGHEKTGHFNALQDTIRNERENAVSVALQGEWDNKLHQQTTGKNKPFGFGKDEVGSSNLPSSSSEKPCISRVKGNKELLPQRAA